MMTNTRANIIKSFVASYAAESRFNDFKLFPLVAPLEIDKVVVYTPISTSIEPSYRDSIVLSTMELQIDIYSKDYEAVQELCNTLQTVYNNKSELGSTIIHRTTLNDISESVDDDVYRIRCSIYIDF